ncbi:hypothetical protein QQ045_015028 [Rhodiola kirilowii]
MVWHGFGVGGGAVRRGGWCLRPVAWVLVLVALGLCLASGGGVEWHGGGGVLPLTGSRYMKSSSVALLSFQWKFGQSFIVASKLADESLLPFDQFGMAWTLECEYGSALDGWIDWAWITFLVLDVLFQY